MPNHLTSAEDNAPWQQVTDSILFHVFSFLTPEALVKAAQVCHHWHRVASDEFIWKDLTHSTWKINRRLSLASGAWSWKEEFKRLRYHIPVVEDEVLSEHRDQVLHVSFSHDGNLFATCSKDGFIKVWASTYPVQLKYYDDMKALTWKYTQFSQFNKTDTLLLVSGVHFGSQSTSGEIAVFNLEGGFQLQCRVLNKPYDIFGTWYNERHLLSGNLHWLGNLASCSVLWLNKADQALESEREAVVRRLYKFRNVNASSMRTIIITDNINFSDQEVQPTSGSKSGEQTQSSSSSSESAEDGVNDEEQPSASCREEPMEESQSPMEAEAPPCECECDKHCDEDVVDGNFKSRDTEPSAGASSAQSQPVISIVSRTGQKQKVKVTQRVKSLLSPHKGRNKLSETPDSMLEGCTTGEPDAAVAVSVATKCPKCGKDFATVGDAVTVENVGGRLRSSHSTEHIFDKGMDLDSSASSSASKPPKRTHDCDEAIDALAHEKDKYLIFTMGTKTYTPHQIGIKRIDAQQVANVMKADMTYHPPVLPPVPQPDVLDGDQDPDEEFDTADHVVELNGHIIGMCLSPDHRHLYVNSRAWPPEYFIQHALHPPPIAQEIDIHVIDLATMQRVGVTHQSHRAYTPNDECFFIFLDVSQQYVASGAEDKHGYLWDRHYDVCLARFPHTDVVNCVVFNPADPEMLVTVSDDHTVKIWRSRNRLKERQDAALTQITNPSSLTPSPSTNSLQ